MPAHAARLIRSADIADNTIASRDIRNSSIVGADVRNGRLDGRDIRDGSIERRDLASGLIPAAIAGTPGAPGTTGPVGPAFGSILDTGDISTYPEMPYDGMSAQKTVELPAAGRLMVFGSWDDVTALNCANADIALAVDGGALGGSTHRVSFPFDNEGGTIIGMTPNVVAAGTHTVRLVAACDSGGAGQSVTLKSARVGVVLLGG